MPDLIAACVWADEVSARNGPNVFGVVFPVVVLRGPLYEAWLESADALVLHGQDAAKRVNASGVY